VCIQCNFVCYDDFVEATPPVVEGWTIPVNDNDPVILRWNKPVLTVENKEFFQGFNVSISRSMLTKTLNQRSKRNTNIPASDTQIIMVGPDQTNYTYDQKCPYNDSFTLCPYSEYCFSVVSLFAFEDTFIDVSNSTNTTMCHITKEAGKCTIL